MTGSQGQTPGQATPGSDGANFAWVVPLLLAIAILFPIVSLIFSNLNEITVRWLGLEWTAPAWMISTAIFVAGVLLSPVIRWGLGKGRKRKQK